MNPVQSSNYLEIKFTRDTKVDYRNGNAVTNTIFKQFDKDLSGDFNDEEWAAYEKVLKKNESRKQEIENMNSGVVQHYNKKLEKLSKEYEKFAQKYSKLDSSAWDRLMEFEQKHPQIQRCGYTKKSEVPAKATEFDISAFMTGIYDEEKQTFTGETYKKGYLLGLETLDEKERKEYLQLLKDASNLCKKSQEMDKQFKDLNNKFDKYYALQDMANSGVINKVGSKDYEEQAYQQYVQIRSEANPFYKEIKNLEQKREVLRLKGKPSSEDAAQIEQYNIQLQQLYEASSQWTIANVDNLQKVKSNGFMLTDLSEQLTYSDSDKKELTNTHSIGAMYSNENFNIISTLSNAQKYTVKPKCEFENTFSTMLMGEYKRDNIALSSVSSLNTDKNMINYNQTLGFGYKNVKLEVNENINSMKMEMPNENGELVKTRNNSYTTTATLSHSIGKFTNAAAVSFSEYGNTYQLSSNANFNQKLGENSSLYISPSISAAFNDKAKNCTISPNLNCTYSYYNSNGLQISASANESFSSTMQAGTEAQLNHSLTTTGNITYKGLSTSLKFNDLDNSYSHSDTYGVEVLYRTKKAGSFGVEYSYQNTNNKMISKNTGTNLVSFKYTAPLDWSGKK